jgi:hypothetical protein
VVRMSDDRTVTKSIFWETRWEKKSRELKINSQLTHFVRFVPCCAEDTENYIQNSQMPITIDYPHKKTEPCVTFKALMLHSLYEHVAY